MQLKKLFFILALLGSMLLPAQAQFSGGTAYRIISGSSLPATCTAGPGVADVYVKTGGSPGIYYCSATNTWTLAAGGGGGTGDVVGPASATDNAVVRFDLTTGKLVQNSVVIVGDTGNITGVGTLNTHTIPGGTDTFALLNATQTLASKTLSSPLVSGTLIQTSNAAQAFCSGPNGCTNPVLSTVNNVASAATGVSITGNAAGAGAVVAITSPNATENLTIQAKGSGAAVILGTTAGAQVVHFGSTAGSSIYSTTASGGDINFRSANSTFTFQGASGATFPSSSGWIELNGAARLFGPSAGVLRLGANGSTTAAGKLLVAPSTVTALGDITIGNATNPELSFSDTAETGGIRFNSTSNVLEWSNDRSTWNAFSGGGGSGANPTASVGLSAVNGVATTFMRSDAAPPLDQAITPTWTGAHIWSGVTGTFRRNSIGTTSTDGLVLENNTAAALGAQQYSPRQRWHASGYKTNATAGPQDVDWIAEIQPVQQTGYPTPYLTYSFSINNAAYVKAVEFRVDAAGATNFGVNVTGDGNFGTPALAINSSKGFYGTGNDLAVKTGNNFAAAFVHNGGVSSFALRSTGEYFWTNNSGNPTATRDTSWARLAAGSIRATNGSTGAGNLMLGPSTAAFGTSAAGVLAFSNSTAPSTSTTDVVQVYSGDAAATDHNLYARNEAGQINRLTGLAVRNSAQFDVTSSTTLATITGLSENVEAGRTYAFRAYVQTSAGAGGIKLAVGGTATATAISYEGELTSASDDNVVLIDRATALGTTVCDSSTTTSGTCKIEGVIQVNAAGTLVIQFAQSASNGTASSVLANQYLQLIPIS